MPVPIKLANRQQSPLDHLVQSVHLQKWASANGTKQTKQRQQSAKLELILAVAENGKIGLLN